MMLIRSNIAEVIKDLERIRAAVANGGNDGTGGPNFSDALAGAVNEGRGKMIRRIFNEKKDANGQSLGKYIGAKTRITNDKFRILKYGDDKESTKQKKKLRKNIKDQVGSEEKYSEYEKKRLAHGRQIPEKDLQFNGSLKASIETVRAENKATIAITNPENAKIAGYQEQQIGNIRATGTAKGSAAAAPIFRLSREEFELVRTEGKRLITDVIKRIIENK